MQTIKLIDVCEFVRNGANIKQLSNETRGIPITRIETLANDKFNRDRLGYANITDDSFSDYYLKKGDVLLSHINGAKFIGRSVMYEPKEDETIIHGMNLLCLRFKSNYNPKFFCYYAKSKAAKNYFDKHTKKAVNQASITSTDIKNMPIPNISLEKQNAIIEILDILFARTESIEKQLCLFDELLLAQFHELFSNCDKARLGDYIVQVRGVSYKPDDLNNEANEKYITLLRANNIKDHMINFDDLQFVDKSKVSETQYILKNDILVCASSGSKDLVGKSAICNFEGKYTFGAFCKLIRVKKGLLPTYLSEYFRSRDYKDYIKEIACGSNINNLRNEHLDNIMIPLPTINEQEEFEKISDSIEKAKTNLRNEYSLTIELINKKMSDYFFDYEED